eukprot:TRINITY_DN10291_c0_g2_i1.p1 TRINITY_DN10291_c0_g2~~TRINITY_DN10291_c0_g2_i1.p1  ORF type:complete len:112 (-),score=16.53 TRINITY_DN10291_c0_g2_i1:149-484(-)
MRTKVMKNMMWMRSSLLSHLPSHQLLLLLPRHTGPCREKDVNPSVCWPESHNFCTVAAAFLEGLTTVLGVPKLMHPLRHPSHFASIHVSSVLPAPPCHPSLTFNQKDLIRM